MGILGRQDMWIARRGRSIRKEVMATRFVYRPADASTVLSHDGNAQLLLRMALIWLS